MKKSKLWLSLFLCTQMHYAYAGGKISKNSISKPINRHNQVDPETASVGSTNTQLTDVYERHEPRWLENKSPKQNLTDLKAKLGQLHGDFDELIDDEIADLWSRTRRMDSFESQLKTYIRTLPDNPDHIYIDFGLFNDPDPETIQDRPPAKFKFDEFIAAKASLIADLDSKSRFLRSANLIKNRLLMLMTKPTNVSDFKYMTRVLMDVTYRVGSEVSSLKLNVPDLASVDYRNANARNKLLQDIRNELRTDRQTVHGDIDAIEQKKLLKRRKLFNKLMEHDLVNLTLFDVDTPRFVRDLKNWQTELRQSEKTTLTALDDVLSATSDDDALAKSKGLKHLIDEDSTLLHKNLLRTRQFKKVVINPNRYLELQKELSSLSDFRPPLTAEEGLITLYDRFIAKNNNRSYMTFYQMFEEMVKAPGDYANLFDDLVSASPLHTELSEADRAGKNSLEIKQLLEEGNRARLKDALLGMVDQSRYHPHHLELDMMKLTEKPVSRMHNLFEFSVAPDITGHLIQKKSSRGYITYVVETRSSTSFSAWSQSDSLNYLRPVDDVAPIRYQISNASNPFDFLDKLQYEVVKDQTHGASVYTAFHDVYLSRLRHHLTLLLDTITSDQTGQLLEQYEQLVKSMLKDIHTYGEQPASLYLLSDLRSKLKKLATMDMVFGSLRQPDGTYANIFLHEADTTLAYLKENFARKMKNTKFKDLIETAERQLSNIKGRLNLASMHEIFAFKNTIKKLVALNSHRPFLYHESTLSDLKSTRINLNLLKDKMISYQQDTFLSMPDEAKNSIIQHSKAVEDAIVDIFDNLQFEGVISEGSKARIQEHLDHLLALDKTHHFMEGADKLKLVKAFEAEKYLANWVSALDEVERLIEITAPAAGLQSNFLTSHSFEQFEQIIGDLASLCQQQPHSRRVRRDAGQSNACSLFKRNRIAPELFEHGAIEDDIVKQINHDIADHHLVSNSDEILHIKPKKTRLEKFAKNSFKLFNQGLVIGGTAFDIWDLAYGAYLMDQSDRGYTAAEREKYRAEAIQSYVNAGVSVGYSGALMAAQAAGWPLSIGTIAGPISVIIAGNMITSLALDARYKNMSQIEKTQLYLHQLNYKYNDLYKNDRDVYHLGYDPATGENVLWPTKDEEIGIRTIDLTQSEIAIEHHGSLILHKKERHQYDPLGWLTFLDKETDGLDKNSIRVSDVLKPSRNNPIYPLIFSHGAQNIASQSYFVEDVGAMVLPTTADYNLRWDRTAVNTGKHGLYAHNHQLGSKIARRIERRLFADKRTSVNENRHISAFKYKTLLETPVSVRLPQRPFTFILPASNSVAEHLSKINYLLEAPAIDRNDVNYYQLVSYFFALQDEDKLDNKTVNLYVKGGHAKTLWSLFLPTVEFDDALHVQLDASDRTLTLTDTSVNNGRKIILHVDPQAQGRLVLNGQQVFQLDETIHDLGAPTADIEDLEARYGTQSKNTIVENQTEFMAKSTATDGSSKLPQTYTLYFSNASKRRVHYDFIGLDESFDVLPYQTYQAKISSDSFKAIQEVQITSPDMPSGASRFRMDTKLLNDHLYESMICFATTGHQSHTFNAKMQACNPITQRHEVAAEKIHPNLPHQYKRVFKIDHHLPNMRYKRLSFDNQSEEHMFVTLSYRLPKDQVDAILDYETGSTYIPKRHRLALLEEIQPNQQVSVEKHTYGDKVDFMIPEGAIVTSFKLEFSGKVDRHEQMTDMSKHATFEHQGAQVSASLKKLILNQPFTEDMYLDLITEEPLTFHLNTVQKIQSVTLQKQRQRHLKAHKEATSEARAKSRPRIVPGFGFAFTK